MWEEAREYSKAIDRYMEIGEGMFPPEHLEEIYNNCFNLAMNYAKDKIQAVVPTLGQRLMRLNRFDSAAEIFEAVGYYEKAIEAYMQCQKFDRAFECARNVRP
jgi:tetratricopeptide (TPR) repeat protein